MSSSSSAGSSSSSSYSSPISFDALTSTEPSYSPVASSPTVVSDYLLSSSTSSCLSWPLGSGSGGTLSGSRGTLSGGYAWTQLEPAVAAARRDALLAVYDAIGPDKWREAIDGKDQKYGKYVYDQCLHHGNDGVPEPGFLASIEAGMEWIRAHLDAPVGSDEWLDLHAIVCAHFQSRRKTGTDGTRIGGVVRSQFREPEGGMTGLPHLVSNQAKREICNGNPQVARLKHVRCKRIPRSEQRTANGSSYYSLTLSSSEVSSSSSQGYQLYFLAMKRTRRMAYFDVYAARFHHTMRKLVKAELRWLLKLDPACELAAFVLARHPLKPLALGLSPELAAGLARLPPTRPDPGAAALPAAHVARELRIIARDKLAAIVAYHQAMQRLHVARDGTQRTCVLILNKHLTEFGFHPCILREPHRADINSVAEFTRLVEAGMRRWAKHVTDAAASAAAATRRANRLL